MKFFAAVIGLCLASATPALAAAPQTLVITIHGDGARATQLPVYDPGRPVAVTVSEAAARTDAVTIEANGPSGESQQVVLTRDAPASFDGMLRLNAAGTWRLRVSSHAGNLTTITAPVALDVQAPPPSNAAAVGFAVGIAVFAVVGGGGFMLLRRVLASEPAELQRAA